MKDKDPSNALIAGKRRLNAFFRASVAPRVQNHRLPVDLQAVQLDSLEARSMSVVYRREFGWE
jgi:hypothetical protein